NFTPSGRGHVDRIDLQDFGTADTVKTDDAWHGETLLNRRFQCAGVNVLAVRLKIVAGTLRVPLSVSVDSIMRGSSTEVPKIKKFTALRCRGLRVEQRDARRHAERACYFTMDGPLLFNFPDPHRAIATAGGEQRPLPIEGHRVDGVGVAEIRRQ